MGLFDITVKCNDVENRCKCSEYRGFGRCSSKMYSNEKILKHMRAKYHKSGNTITILECPIQII